MLTVRKVPRLHSDYQASFLRAQIVALQNVLQCVEDSDRYDAQCVLEGIRRIEYAMRRFRKSKTN